MSHLAKRVVKHLKPNAYRRHFQAQQKDELSRAVAAAESGHRGEIRVVVEAKLPLALLLDKVTSRDRAIHWFSDLHVWDTEGNTGILLYLLLAEHKLEIVADRGIAAKVPQQEWDAICQQLQQDMAAERVVAGLSLSIKQLGQLLATHFPIEPGTDNPNELSNVPVLIL
ncbi:TPM domain-containing protein [soil metagenome]